MFLKQLFSPKSKSKSKNNSLLSLERLVYKLYKDKKLSLKDRAPNIIYNRIRNLWPWVYSVNKKVKRLRLSVDQVQQVSLNLNYIEIWEQIGQFEFRRVQENYTCRMSSTSEKIPSTDAVLFGDRWNTVSIHSKRNKNPWWEIEFDREIDLAHLVVFNRKDQWGTRFQHHVIQAYDDKNRQVYYNGRSENFWLNIYKNDLLPLLNSFSEFSSDNNIRKQGNMILNKIHGLLRKVRLSKKDLEALKSEISADLKGIFNTISPQHHELPTTEEEAVNIDIPLKGIKYFRVICYGKRNIKDPVLFLKLNGSTIKLEPQRAGFFQDKIAEDRQAYTYLETEHSFLFTAPDLKKAKKISLWTEKNDSAHVFLLRRIEVSKDGKKWLTIEETLSEYYKNLTPLILHECFSDGVWGHDYIKALGKMVATYRIPKARSFKKQFGSRVDYSRIEAVTDYMKEIEEYGQKFVHLPKVIYSRHGLIIPFAEQDQDFLAERMFAFSRFVEEKLNLKTALCYGTLLGIYRDKEFLPFDDDIDLACVVDLPEGADPAEESEKWAQKIRDFGFECKKVGPTSYNMHVSFPGADMDLFFTYRQPEDSKILKGHMRGYKIEEIPSEIFDPFTTIKFKGYEFYAPKDIEAFLELRYGKGWVTPDPMFEL